MGLDQRFRQGFLVLKADPCPGIFSKSQGNIFLIIKFSTLKLQVRKQPLRKWERLTTAT